MTKYLKISLILLSALTLSSCAYRPNVYQGNYVEQKDINKLRIQMNKEQVTFILGSPVVQNTFSDDVWHYVYDIQQGNGHKVNKKLSLNFKGDKLSSMSGDFKQPEEFDTPLEL